MNTIEALQLAKNMLDTIGYGGAALSAYTFAEYNESMRAIETGIKQADNATERKYYILMIRGDKFGWDIAYGDYSKRVIDQERFDCYDGLDWRILESTSGSQESVNAAIADFLQGIPQ